MTKLPAQPVKGLIDGLAVLQAIAASDSPLSGKALAQELGLEVTRVNRLLKTLAHLGMLYRTNSRQYISGPGMHILAAQSLHGSGLLQCALPYLEQLTKYNHIVALGVLWRVYASYLYHWEPNITSKIEAIGHMSLFPATQSSVGMILLAEKSDEDILQILPHKDIPGYGDDVQAALIDIQKFRKQRYAQEFYKGNRSLAVKLGNPAYAAIALSGTIEEHEVIKYVKILQETGQKIQAVYGR